jgi:energy-coupling factor transporter ATP-binding protein EcfA2
VCIRPHILLLDEPTNSLDPESIDALAKAINEFEGGMVLVSHDMRLISQVAKEIWICDNKTITPYKGDIQSFKLAMRAQMGLEDGNKPAPKALRGDASVKINSNESATTKPKPKKLEVVNEKKASVTPPVTQAPRTVTPTATAQSSKQEDDDTTTATTITASSSVPSVSTAQPTNVVTSPGTAPTSIDTTAKVALSESSGAVAAAPVKGRYIPPHLRKKMMEEQQQQ